MDIPAYLKQVTVVRDKYRLETTSKQGAVRMNISIYKHRKSPSKIPHSLRYVGQGGFQKQMVVVFHHAIAVGLNLIFLVEFFEKVNKRGEVIL
jgi:hypothetical protein